MTDARSPVYLEEWVELHNETLRRHPKYRPDMEVIAGAGLGSLVYRTKDPEISNEDLRVFNEVAGAVSETHRLMLP
jgi:hypothetical protein